MKSKIDILFVLSKKNKLFNVSLPVWFFVTAIVTVTVILTAFVIILLDYSNRYVDQKNLMTLKRENEVLREELKKYQTLTENINQSLSELQQYDVKLRIYSGLELVNTDVRRMGIGGIESDTAFTALNRDVREQVTSVSASLKQLLAEAKFQRQSYDEIMKYLKEKEYLRNHTPTIEPVAGWYMSGFGMRIDPFTGYLRMHDGLDISAPAGTPIVAPADGSVKSIQIKDGYGLTVEIDHGYGIKTYYAHCLSSLCQIGQAIKRGDPIALVGETGRATGPHVHYEIRVANTPVNPLRYIIKNSSIAD